MKTQALDFHFISDDGRQVTYRAIVRDKGLRSEPVYALTVITGSPHDPKQQAELEQFLRQLKAAFALVGPLKEQDPVDHQPIRFDPSREILFAAELITVDADGIFEIDFEVDSFVDGVTKALSRWRRRAFQRFTTRQVDGSIIEGKKQIFKAVGHKRRARVTCSRGAVKVHPARRGYHDPDIARHDYPYKEAHTRRTARVTIWDNIGGRSNFTIHNNFDFESEGPANA